MSSPVSSLRILPAEAESPLEAESLAPAEAGGGFADSLRGAIDEMGQLSSQADTKVASVLEGSGTDVHSALIAVEKADLFQRVRGLPANIHRPRPERKRMTNVGHAEQDIVNRREPFDQRMILENGRRAAAVTFHGGGRIERAEIRKHDLSMFRRD